jgi:hypothetical protein
MPLLNPPDALPEAMRFILRVLLANDGPLPEQEVRRLVAPVGLNRKKTDLEGEGHKTGASEIIFEASVDALRGLGLASREPSGDRSITVKRVVSDRFRDWSDLTAKEFSNFLAGEILFSPSGTDGNEIGAGGQDLSEAVSFVMFLSDPLNGFTSFEGGEGRKFLDAQFGELGTDRDGWVVGNTERYQSLRRWLTYIGVTRIFKTGMIIEPSRRIESRVLSTVDAQISIDHLLDRLGELLPFTDRGTGGMMIKNRMATEFGVDEVSPGLAVGLEVLAAQGKVRLMNLDDAPSFAFPSSSDSRTRYSHIAPAVTR